MYKSILAAAVIVTFILGCIAPAQQTTSDQFAATVREIKGRCFIKENEAAKPRILIVGEQLQADQQVLCEAKSHVKIRFRASGAEKIIEAKVGLSWYTIPNVPEVRNKTTAKIMGREKGEGDSKAPPGLSVAGEQLGKRKPISTDKFDAVDIYWKSRPKRFLLVAASKSTLAGSNLPFTKIDAIEVSKALTRLGYQPLGAGILQGEAATAENFISELQKIRTLPDDALVIVYYSGHAAAELSGKDLWLQLYGQKKFGEHFGLSIDDLIGAARGITYKGELSIILDTCFSGVAANSTQLKNNENTVVLTSSSEQQPSVSIASPEDKEISAFTYYLIQGLSDGWERVDGDQDGIVMYSDLAVYIGNRLVERFRDRTLLGPMQPQLFGGSDKNWIAYDAAQARNRNTEPRKTVELEQSLNLQDPEKTARILSRTSSDSNDSYLRALQAVNDERFEEAMSLLGAAEKEGRLSSAQINWARGYVAVSQNQMGAAREWLDRAVAETRDNPNSDLIGYAAAMHFVLGSWPRAEELFKQVLQLPVVESTAEDESEDRLTPPIVLFMLTMINLFQGDITETDLYLKRLKDIDPKKLEAEEKGASLLVPYLEAISDAAQQKTDSARQKLEALRDLASSDKEPDGLKSMLAGVVKILLEALGTEDRGGQPDPAATAAHFQQWESALKKREFTALIFLLTQTQILAASSQEILNSAQAEDLLSRTVKLAQERKDEKPTNEVSTINGLQVTIQKGDEKEFVLEAATLLVSAGQLYSTKGDISKAETLLKDGIKLQMQQEGGVALSFGAVMQLVELYRKSARFADAETELKRLLKGLRQPLGEENLLAYLVQDSLGGLYEKWRRPDDAETAYRESLKLGLALGSSGVFAIEGRKTLADFLAKRNNHVEAVSLYEAAIRNLKSGSDHNLYANENLGKLQFSLSRSYYTIGNFEAAEKSLAKAYQIFSSDLKSNLVDSLDCLEWQWATAKWLKKQPEADAFYKKILDTIDLELAKPEPNDELGDEIRKLAFWYKDWDWEKSEELFQLALNTQQRLVGAESAEVADVWLNWSELKESRHQITKALDFVNKAEELYQKHSPRFTGRISYVKYLKGLNFYWRRDFEQAQQLLKQSAELLDQVAADNDEDFVRNQWSKYTLAIVERNLQNYKAANSILTTLIMPSQNRPPLDPESMVACFLELALIARLQGKHSEVTDWLARASKQLDQVPADKWLRRRAKFAHERGMLALANNDYKEAELLLRNAVSLGTKDPYVDLIALADFMDDLARVLRLRKKARDASEMEKNAQQIRAGFKN